MLSYALIYRQDFLRNTTACYCLNNRAALCIIKLVLEIRVSKHWLLNDICYATRRSDSGDSIHLVCSKIDTLWMLVRVEACFILSQWKQGNEGQTKNMFRGLYFWVCCCQPLRNSENTSKNQKTWFVNVRHVQATEQTVHYHSKVWDGICYFEFNTDALNGFKGIGNAFIMSLTLLKVLSLLSNIKESKSITVSAKITRTTIEC